MSVTKMLPELTDILLQNLIQVSYYQVALVVQANVLIQVLVLLFHHVNHVSLFIHIKCWLYF